MALAVERRDGSPERRVLIGMVISRAVLGPIAEKWEAGLFASKWGNLVGGWCVAHYRKYHRAPGSSITHYFEAWAESGRDRETVELVESFLEGLSDEAERIKKSLSPDHLLDVASELFEKVHLNDLMAQTAAFIERGEVNKARALVDRSRKVEIGLGAGVDVLADEAVVEAAFDKRGEVVVSYPGAIGNFFGPSLGRDSFIAFMAPEKRGKSFWLQDMAYRGAEQERNVAYFEVGDMSQDQVLRRIACRVCERPLEANLEHGYNYPLEIDPKGERSIPDLRMEQREAKYNLTAEDAVLEMRRLGKRVGATRFKLSCHPNSSISVNGIESILDGWARDNWHPDVVVVDYADILAPLDGRADTRDQINATWKALRAMSQRLHCLVVTATQSDADSYSTWVLDRANFSEDKRKYAHVTGMVGINQTTAEKDKGLFRLNWVVLRELEFSERKCVWTASCLAVANPCVLSTFGPTQS